MIKPKSKSTSASEKMPNYKKSKSDAKIDRKIQKSTKLLKDKKLKKILSPEPHLATQMNQCLS